MPFARAGPEHDRTESGKPLESQSRNLGELSALFVRAEVFGGCLEQRDLNDWIKDPQHFIPGTDTFQGIPSDQQRADLLAFLGQATQPGSTPPKMGGMMGGSDVNLKTLGPEHRVRAVVPTETLWEAG
jgi:hypothetical protein